MDQNTSESWVERIIQQARDRGMFDDLAGKGRPIDWADESLVDDEWIMAFRLMREHGFAPEWIELQKEIRAELDAARDAILAAWQRREQRLNQARDEQRRHIESEWQLARRRFADAVSELNARISDFNLIVPLAHLQKAVIDVEDELAQLGITV
jgi:DnaJ family protein C protein 28